jgi:predicted dehydrogenase
MVGYMRRFAVTFKKAKELLAEKTIGEVTSFKAYAFSSDFYESKKGAKVSAARGGVLRDLGCHVLDLALWFFGDLQVDSAKLEPSVDDASEDSASFTAANSDGLGGEFDISWCIEKYRMPEVGLSISGSKGIINVNDDKVELNLNKGKTQTLYRHDLQDNVFFWLGGPEYFREDECFVKSVIEGCNAYPNFGIASKVDQIIDQIRHEAEKSGK